jgi:hypothetical protein
MARIKSQADQRRNQIMTDQHGRRWFAVIEKASGHPTGRVSPEGWRPPHPKLVAPMKFMKFRADDPAHLTINYDRWILELEQANRQWDENRIRLGRLVHGSAFDPTGPTPIELTVLLGPRPMSPLPVLAMKQGNRWALGEDVPRPPEADRFFPKPEAQPDSLVFTETSPVFTEPVGELPEPAAGSPAADLVQLVTEIKARCPAELRGAARANWILAEIGKLTEAAPQPQEA